MKSRLLAFAFLAALSAQPVHAADDYTLGPDSFARDGVPRGTVSKFTNWSSRSFTNTVRDWWIYVPAQYDSNHAACVMVFQDGGGYVGTNGAWRVPTVF